MIAEVVEHGRDPKIIVFKYKAKTRYRRRRGHRQGYTRLAVRQIMTAEGPLEAEEKPKRRRAAKEATKPARRTRARKPEAEAQAEAASVEAPEQEKKPARRARPRKAKSEAVVEKPKPAPRARARKRATKSEAEKPKRTRKKTESD